MHHLGYFAAQVMLLTLERNVTNETITIKHTIENLHKYSANIPAICSAVSVHETNIATVGEDGR